MRKRLFELIFDGRSDAEVAAAVSTKRADVTRQAVTAFRRRHAGELVQAVHEVVRQAGDYAIARLVDQVAGLDADWQALEAVQQARAADTRYSEPGYSTGRMVRQVKVVGVGPFARAEEEFKVDTGVIAERRNLVMAAAELLGQLKQKAGGGGDTWNIENAVLIRRYVGIDPEELG